MSVLIESATVYKDPEIVQNERMNVECCNLQLRCDDIGFIFANCYGATANEVKCLKAGDRIVVTMSHLKLYAGSKSPYIGGKLVEFTPMTISKTRVITGELVAKDEVTMHDITPPEERKTTRDGKPRIETNYALAAVQDKTWYKEEAEEDEYAEVPW